MSVIELLAASRAAKALTQLQAQAALLASTALTAPAKPMRGNSCAFMGDSNIANGSQYSQIPGSGVGQGFRPKGYWAHLVALSGGAIRPLSVGYPATSALGTGKAYKLIVVNGGNNYNPATTTFSFDTNSGGAGLAATPVIVNGVITGTLISNNGNGGYAQQPRCTITDSSGSGSGAIIAVVLTGQGCFATGGMSSEEIEGFVPDAIASGAGNVFVMAGTNDYNAGMTQARSRAAIVRIAQRLTAAGIRTFFVVPPNSNHTQTDSHKKKYVINLSRWLINQLPILVPGVVTLSALAELMDGTTDNWPAGSIESDGLHTTPAGSYAMAKVLWAQVQRYFTGTIASGVVSPTYDAYNATDNPDGNLLSISQSLMVGSSTAAADAGWTGTKMSGIVLENLLTSGIGPAASGAPTSTGTKAASVDDITVPRKGKCQTLTVNVTGATVGEVFRVKWTFPSDATKAPLNVQGGNTLQLGDTIQAVLGALKLSNMAGIKGVKFYLAALNQNTLAGATVLTFCDWGAYEDANGNGAQYNDTLWLPTRELVIPASTFAVGLYLDFVAGAAACSFTANIFDVAIRKLN